MATWNNHTSHSALCMIIQDVSVVIVACVLLRIHVTCHMPHGWQGAWRMGDGSQPSLQFAHHTTHIMEIRSQLNYSKLHVQLAKVVKLQIYKVKLHVQLDSAT